MVQPSRGHRRAHDGVGVEVFAPCAANTEVAFYTIEGGGHAWPGGNEPFLAAVRRGNTPRDVDAGRLIWDFFQKHPKR